ncbi:MAG: NAD(P)H-hydrate dehydratase [Candidatus Pacebacteria bacterium]|nr:NAD(P)H-hydrate dehydratase [Candidatus Paceibacterota bacterium]
MKTLTSQTRPSAEVKHYLEQIKLPDPNSHKGQNGKLLIVGGSSLFHAASKWSLDVASKFVDMVFYSSVPQNNKLIQQAKTNFWNGIVVPRQEVEDYLEEADCILIGPGMERLEEKTTSQKPRSSWPRPSQQEWSNDTQKVVNYLVSSYPNKKWVIDAGALQMIDPQLLGQNCIVTPHQNELKLLVSKVSKKANLAKEYSLLELSAQLNNSLILLKGPVDQIANSQKTIKIKGGNAGMTKGGTGDVLAGLVAALFCTHDRLSSAVVGSYLNKAAGDLLYQKVGPYFNASDLVEAIPQVAWLSQTTN